MVALEMRGWRSVTSNLEGFAVVMRAFAPAPRVVSPENTIALDHVDRSK